MRYLTVLPILLIGLFGYDYHGCCLAQDNLTGWAACIDTVLIMKTTDGGQAWTVQYPDTGFNFYDITCVDELTAWVCGDLGRMRRTTDGGSTWPSLPINLSKNTTRIQFLNDSIGWAVGGNGCVGRTTDGGDTWDQIFTPYFAAEYYGVSFIDEQRGWIVAGYPDSVLPGQGYIDRSTDGGIVWDSLFHSSGYEDFFDVEFLDANVGVVVGGYDNSYAPIIWKSTNGGSSWTGVTAPANAYYLRAVDFVGDRGWAVGRFGSIVRTTDAGNSWSFQANPATTTLFDVDFSDTLHGIACGQNIILYTTDGGQNWNPAAVEETHTPGCDLAVSLRAYPNPARSRIEFKLDPGEVHRAPSRGSGTSPEDFRTQSIKFGIYDASGRQIRAFTLCPAPHALCWDGTDQAGRRVPAGIYLIMTEPGSTDNSIKVILLD